MNNYDDERLLAHKRSVDRDRKAQAILRRQHAMARVANANREV